jgi:iron(III) transport system substrate-binding protein
VYHRPIALAAASLLLVSPASAQTAAEKLYAELAGLPQAQRTERLVEGARKEGALSYIQTVTGTTGARHGDLFAKKYPFLKIDQTTSLGSQDGASRVVQEERAGKHITDALSNAIPDLAEIRAGKLAAVYKTPMTARILPQYKSMLDPESRWTPWYWSEHGISYNSKVIKGDEIPHSWNDLCNPKLKGQVSYDPGETRFLAGLYSMFDQKVEKVEELLKCIGKNEPIIQQGHSARMQLMLAGDHGVGGDQYLYFGESLRRKAPDKNPFVAAFDIPVMAYAAGVTINANAPHPYAAALLTDWTLEDDSQKYMADLLRGPLAIPHPYIPETATLVTFGIVDKKITDRLHETWNTHVSRQRH